MKIHKMDQYSDEYWKIRDLRFTASMASTIAVAGKGLETYVYEILAQHLSTQPKEQISNIHIDRGNELEPHAREAYEIATGDVVNEVGLITNDKVHERCGASPDGLVGKKKGIEIKCMMDSKHVKNIFDYPEIKIERPHFMQMQMQMLVAELESVDYILYNPNFEKSMLIVEVKPDKKEQDKIINGLEVGSEMLDKLLKKL